MSNQLPEIITTIAGQTMRGTDDLRRQLYEVLQDMRAGKIGSTQANAAARIGEVIVASLHVELQVVKELGAMHHGLPPLALHGADDAEAEDAEVVDEPENPEEPEQPENPEEPDDEG